MGMKTKFLDNIIIIAIFLVLIQTFLEDWVVLMGYSYTVKNILVYSGFFFDLFFTIEFLVRFYLALTNASVRKYIVHENGWIDFFASVPLLMLNSGPSLFALLSGTSMVALGGILNILKVIKAIRIARILRLLRVLKIFRNIKHAESQMAQRHISRISSMAISVFVFTILMYTLAGTFLNVPDVETAYMKNSELIGQLVQSEKPNFAKIPQLVEVQKNGISVYKNGNLNDLGPGEFQVFSIGNSQYLVDIREIAKAESSNNLLYFFVVILLILSFLFFYSPHFAMTISDPIHVLKRGLGEAGYNLQVRIDNEYSKDEIFELAAIYNESYLPEKQRSSNPKPMVELNMDDLSDILGG
jgi:hypothetical protein